MKRYLAFYGSNYYPSGGMEDFIGDFDTAIEAKESVIEKNNSNILPDKEWDWNWYQIWDSETRLFVDKSYE